MAVPAQRMDFLTGERVALRPLEPADVTEAHVRRLNMAPFAPYGEPARPLDRERVVDHARRIAKDRTGMILAVVDRASGSAIGDVRLEPIDWSRRVGSTAIFLDDPDDEDRSREVWSLLLHHAFSALGLRKVVASVPAGQAAEVAALRALGFALEGTLRGEARLDGVDVDLLRFGVFADELRA
jgi:RimJ/RimL family protein N-acetyltransferase